LAMNRVDGKIIHGLLAMSFPAPGTASGQVLVSVSDVTELKRAEEKIRKLNEELQFRAAMLESANKELESFSYSVSHDLRAPLRSIDGFTRILLENHTGQLRPDGLNCLHTILTATERMGQLIEDMLRLAKVTGAEICRAPLDLSALVGDVARELRSAGPGRKVEFVVEPHLIVPADDQLMRIVLVNLLGNAWKFTSKQSAARIEFGRTTHEGAPVYFVRDNGVGFDMAYAQRLFGAFQRFHSVKEFPGTGVGLATVQRIIQRHGGQVWAESVPGQGATFYFTLPY
jgi:light-regulated signal transduction histidine kinase (bacteriophytochrome)